MNSTNKKPASIIGLRNAGAKTEFSIGIPSGEPPTQGFSLK